MMAGVAALALGWTGAASAETAVERGKYLVEGVVGCGNCHTPKGPNGPVRDRALSGGPPVVEPVFTAYPSNITPDRETGIGAWTDAEIKLAIREGKRPPRSRNGGTIIGPPMPIELYRGMADADLDAIVAYLRTVPAVKNVVPKSTYKIALPPAYGAPVDKPIEEPARTDKVAYGAYMASALGHCIECHTPLGAKGRAEFETALGAGGRIFNGPWGVSAAKNITPDMQHGLGSWSDAEIERAIRSGIGKDGHTLMPPMGYGYYATISADDMSALIAYLRSMPPKKNP
jgi:mono/diheme cytochrome c family protein